jgi:hypothetical protein
MTRRIPAESPARHRALVLAGHAILLVVALSGLRNLRADYSADQFFLFAGPEREVFDEFKSHFPRGDLPDRGWLV